MNTRSGAEISLPGYAKLDYERDLRADKPLAAGGGGSIYFGIFLNPSLRKKYSYCADSIAVKHVIPPSTLTEEEALKCFHQEVAITRSPLYLS